MLVSFHLLHISFSGCNTLGEVILKHLNKGGEMKGYISSQVRYPADLYATLKKRAYQERRSVNSLVVEAVTRLLNEKSPGA